MSLDRSLDRRAFLRHVATATGAVVLLPGRVSTVAAAEAGSAPTPASADFPPELPTPADLPKAPPADWNAVAFNKKRANAGAVPASYLADINGPAGDAQHTGKHLPYVPPAVSPATVPAGWLALMWGDPAKGHAKHPNAPKGPASPNGHWYDWIRVRRAHAGESPEVQTTYTGWPNVAVGDSGRYRAESGENVMDDGGRNTVYLAALPPDVKPGDTVRVFAHCRTHGQYVDFLTIPKA